jgi:rhamnogalacturonan endolyase
VPEGGKPLDLGTIDWTPVRRGRQLWQIGTPNRTATEFAGGDAYFAPDTQIQYAVKFPNDVTFTVGQSDPARDWYYEHIPHNIDPEAKVVPFSGVRSKPGKATPYAIRFDLADAPPAGAKATLRLAFCSASVSHLDVSVNDKAAGTVDRLNSTGDSTIVRHNIQGIWFERELPIDAALLQKGGNTLTLTIPEGTLNSGVIYDTVRLELNDSPNANP